MEDKVNNEIELEHTTEDLVSAIKEIVSILKSFKNKEELVEFIKSLDCESGVDTGTVFRAVRNWKACFKGEKAYRFFQKLNKRLKADDNDVIETVKQAFIGFVDDNLKGIKEFSKRIYTTQ